MKNTAKELTSLAALISRLAREETELYTILINIQQLIPNLAKEVTIEEISALSGILDYRRLPIASATKYGIVSTIAQTFAGAKTFNDIPVLAGGGIKFPSSQIASADANTLDDYEEGDWTPILGGDTSESGQTYSVQLGKYAKIGSRVFFNGVIVLSNKGTITGNLVIKGLPFTNSATNSAGSVIWSSFATAFVAMGLALNPSDTKLYVYAITAAATALANFRTTADVNNTTTLIFGGNYSI